MLYFQSKATISRLDIPGPANIGLTWHRAKEMAEGVGGRLLTSQEFKNANLSTGDVDQWQPVSDDVGIWIQSGDAGRQYITDHYWNYTDETVYYSRPTSEGSTNGSSIHCFFYYIQAP